MTNDGTDALEQALALHASPDKLQLLFDRPLPSDVLLLIRIVADDADALANAAARAAVPRRAVIDAAVLYIQQILFHPAADSYRLLGVRADAGGDAIKQHYRWLMRWLHPDRNPERWEVVYSERVNRAWNSLNTQQRRHDYDAQANALAPVRNGGGRIARQSGAAYLSNARIPHPPMMSSRAIRMLPIVVLGGLGIAAVILLVVFASMQPDQRMLEPAASGSSAKAGKEDDSNALAEAVRNREAFEEHVVELSQPVEPAAQSMMQPAQLAAAQTRTGVTDGLPTMHSTAPPATTSLPPDRASAPVAAIPHDGDRIAASQDTLPHDAAGPNPAHAAVHAAISSAMVAEVPSKAIAVVQTTASVSRAHALPATTTGVPTDRQPAPNLASSATQAASADGMSPQHAVMVVPHEFENAYASGDLTRMMRLFAPGAVNNRGGIDAIKADYDRLFHASSARSLRLDELKWVVLPDRIVGSGAFEVRIQRTNEESAEAVRGWIQIEAIPIDGSWKIRSLMHRNSE